MVLDTVSEYRTAMRTFAAMSNLEVWYAHMQIDAVLEEFRSQIKRTQAKRSQGDISQGADPRQHVGVLEADPAGERAGRRSSTSRR